jgi:putative transposase
LRSLTKGASRELGLPSQVIQDQVIQELIDAFIVSRREQGKPRLRWRVSKGAKRCLGWVPLTNQDIDISRRGILALRSHSFRLWQHRHIEGKIASGNVSQDARGRWSCTIVCEVEPQTTNRTKVVGIDLGFQTVASAHNAPNLAQGSFYRDLEPKLAEAHRRGRQRQVRSIHAKIASRRKDALHK